MDASVSDEEATLTIQSMQSGWSISPWESKLALLKPGPHTAKAEQSASTWPYTPTLKRTGACEGTSTCHLIFDKTFYEKMEQTVDEEMDMLDLVYRLTKTSRLGCQVTVQKWMDGMTVQVPQGVRDPVGSKGSQ
ncbi:hypothetical protein J4Q44_G00070060 [Coregonus suidteri]|uniref:Uncharacterized protein n=1 Tax=Coregonus suidteri TaxID=861788 RepID=A0AAN8M496_9TELE